MGWKQVDNALFGASLEWFDQKRIELGIPQRMSKRELDAVWDAVLAEHPNAIRIG